MESQSSEPDKATEEYVTRKVRKLLETRPENDKVL